MDYNLIIIILMVLSVFSFLISITILVQVVQRKKDLEKKILEINQSLEKSINQHKEELEKQISGLNTKLEKQISQINRELENQISKLNDDLGRNVKEQKKELENQFLGIYKNLEANITQCRKEVRYFLGQVSETTKRLEELINEPIDLILNKKVNGKENER